MLAEMTTTEISKAQPPNTFEDNRAVAAAGGSVAGRTRKDIEAQTGKPIVTEQNAADFLKMLMGDVDGDTNQLN